MAKYPNSEVNEEAAKSWSCSPEIARLVWTALCCSRDVNHNGDFEHTSSLFFEQAMQLVFEQTLEPSLLGTRKRVMIGTARVSGTLFVAVRGSKDPSDHLLNFASDVKHEPCGVEELDGSHGGYLSCMKELIPSLRKIFVNDVQTNSNIHHVVFTGSSSGGAVASLLFFYFAAQCSEVFGSAKRSIITFGSPPVTPQNLTTIAEGLPGVESVLAFVNEGDVVSRLCMNYIKSVLDLYRIDVEETLQKQQHGGSAAEGPGLTANPGTTAREWKLPDPSFYQIGRIVILRTNDVGKQLELDYADFSRLLWCDTVVHKGSTYSKHVGALVRSIDPEILPPPRPLQHETCVQRR
ncbi:hypothetical protein NW768_000967 [Fusarium equiseti]|uniref:Fungal lipase-type domain-containing protein n=1 Tax=Fusarium equiseti TaxID=61235 RepID=A0ABQ8RTZ5_FUSEQ|nr:hypothetical protein NW768_000967 [Fusarium equiseti]